MKIKKISVKPWKAPLNTPFKIATGAHTSLDNLLVVLELENGIHGYGEACIATHITGETLAGTRRTLEKIARVLQGQYIHEYLEAAFIAEETAGSNRCASAAVEMAILDAFTKLVGVPLWSLFGEKPRVIQSDMTVVIGTVEEARAAARHIKKSGFKSIKLKVGKDPELDFQRVLAVHEIFPKVELILDANQGWNYKIAMQFLADLKKKKIRPVLLEQPVAKKNLKDLVKLSKKCGVLVCADESASSADDIQKLARMGFKGAVNIKFVKFGIYRAWEAVQLCRKFRFPLMMGVMMESPLATTAAAHFVAGLGGFSFIDLDSAFFMKKPITRGFNIRRDGTYDLSAVRSGIGVIPR